MNRREEEKNGGDKRRLRKVGRDVSGSLTSGRPLSVLKPPLSPRTSFSHSASVEKTAADQARDYGIGMQQRAAMRFVGGLRSPLSQQSAVSTLLCWAEAPSPEPAARLPGGGLSVHSSLRSQPTGLLTRERVCRQVSKRGCSGQRSQEEIRHAGAQ